MPDLYLASRSPRRRDLLKQIGVRFEPLLLRLAPGRPIDADELQQPGEAADRYVERIAHEKAEAALRAVAMRSLLPKPVLAADTVVIVDGEVLGKPANPGEAIAFMQRLSGRSHEVRTAVALAASGPIHAATSVSRVSFRKLTDAEIARYCASGEPYDKAGGYAIQGMAALFIERLEGSYSGVMGLPLYETGQLLAKIGAL